MILNSSCKWNKRIILELIANLTCFQSLSQLYGVCIVSNNSTISTFSLEVIPCCPTVSPRKKVVVAGVSLEFTCVVDHMSNSLPKYLSFKWFKDVNGTYLKIPDKQTQRRNDSTSVLVIKNAQTTLSDGTAYKCQMDYRGKISSGYSRLVVFSG